MKYLAIASATASAIALGAPAFAGGYNEPVVEAPVVVAQPVVAPNADWTGPYAGATLGYGWGDDAADDAEGMLYGVYGGYDYDFGNWVVGGELEYNASEVENDDTGVALDNVTRLKLRAGYDLGPALVYGVLGGAYAEVDAGGDNYSDTGYVYGVGMEYMVTDSLSAGVEVLQHEFDNFDNTSEDLSATTVGARVSFRF